MISSCSTWIRLPPNKVSHKPRRGASQSGPVDPFEPVASIGGLLHWSQSTKEGSSSLSVEIGSYVLLAKLSVSPTAEDLGYASRIVRWLTGKQNYYGGFSSTQV